MRRVATLVARGAPPEEVFAAVTEEAGRLLAADVAVLSRYDPDGTETVVGVWTSNGHPARSRSATGLPLGGRNVTHAGVPRRASRHGSTTTETLGPGRRHRPRRSASGHRSACRSASRAAVGRHDRGQPLEEPLPADTEARLAGFTELAATAIANAEARAEVTASRARIVAAADQARRRIERDLHDGAQQRLVSLALRLRAAQAAVPPELGELGAELDRAVAVAAGALDELREIARGIHPAVLAEAASARRSTRSPAAPRSRSTWRYVPTDGCPSRSRSAPTTSSPRH